jgi:hypothetical protein
MSIELNFVQTIEETRESLLSFNHQAGSHASFTQSLLSQTTYHMV